LATRIAGEAETPVHGGGYRDRKIGFALEAARQAMAHAFGSSSRPASSVAGEDAGLSLGIGLEVFSLEDMTALRLHEAAIPTDGAERLTFVQTPSDLCLHLISNEFRLGCAPIAHVSACAAGADAIGAAFRLVANGRRRWMVAGGSDSMINPLGVGGFCLIGATSTRNEEPGSASRPFDRSRDGFVLGEGAAILVLERLEDACERGATIHAEVIGYGSSLDAHAITAPDPEGRGALLAMRRALADADMRPEEVDCVNAHGTGTMLNDPVEARALHRLFGPRVSSVPVCANKGSIGHLISAAGAVEVVAAILCMKAGVLPPTLNLDDPDPLCNLDHVRGRARAYAHRSVLCNSFGFGGINSCLLLRRCNDSRG
jgi:3-oxoacyl-[acyl-carrier-protein] synthase II